MINVAGSPSVSPSVYCAVIVLITAKSILEVFYFYFKLVSNVVKCSLGR